MDHYIIPAKLARKLALTDFRTGDEEQGYVVNTSDLEVFGLEAAKQMGARYISAWEAKKFIDQKTNK